MIDICNMLQTKGKTKILFVCLGNICRSSSAEGVMKQLIEQAGREDELLSIRRVFFPIIKENCPTVGCVLMPLAAVTT